MLHPKIQIVRTSAALRRIPPARRIRRHVDADRLRVVLQSETYGALLLVEVASEKARDALLANDHAAAAAIGCDILVRAGRIDRALDRLRALR